MIFRRGIAIRFLFIILGGIGVIFAMGREVINRRESAIRDVAADKAGERVVSRGNRRITRARCPDGMVMITRSDMFDRWMCIPGVPAEVWDEDAPAP